MGKIDHGTIAETLRTADRLRESAGRRYEDPGVLAEAALVGRFLCRGHDALPEDSPDPCLASLAELLRDWRERTRTGRLPPLFAGLPCPPDGERVTVGLLTDLLTVAGMWGGETNYDQPTAVSDAGREYLNIPPMLRLPGWTPERIAELYALGFDPVDDYALWAATELIGSESREISYHELYTRALTAFESGPTVTGALLTAALTRIRGTYGASMTTDQTTKTSLWRIAE